MRRSHLCLSLIFSAVVVGIVCIRAEAKDLVLVGEAASKPYKTFVDRGTIKQNGRFVQYWAESIERNNSGKIIYYIRTLETADCESYVFRIRKIHTFIDLQSGIANRTDELGDQGPLHVAPPNSINYAKLNYVCKVKL